VPNGRHYFVAEWHCCLGQVALGFMMNSQEMETAVRLRLNVVVLVLQDNAYGMIRWKQQVDGFLDYGMTFGNPDFAAYAKAYGAKGAKVQTADGLVPALETAFREGGVHLIAAPIDYDENTRVLIDELQGPFVEQLTARPSR
jgi:acetolactate synthase-1/2/3 large subunit